MRGIKKIVQYHEENTGLGYFPFKIKEGVKEPVIVRVLAQAEPETDENGNEIDYGTPVIQALFIHNKFKVLNSTRCPSEAPKRDPENCPLCRVNAPRSNRTFIPVRVRRDEKKDRVQIIEYGRDNLAEVQEVISECPDGDITLVDVKITRHGTGTSTQYKWRVVPNSQRELTAEEKALEVPNMEEIIPIKSQDELEKLAMQYERSMGVKKVEGDGGDAEEHESEEANDIDDEEIPF